MQHQAITCHPESQLRADQLGTVIPPYLATFPVEGLINDHHRFLAQAQDPNSGLLLLTAPGLMDHAQGQPIQGWLRMQDALKLYEMGFYCTGDVLELGTYEGLSTCILAQAMTDSGRTGTLTTVDISYRPPVAANISACGLSSRVEIKTADAVAAVKALLPKRFGFVFADHSHAYDDMQAVCPLLEELVLPGGFVLFHDYNDQRNGQDANYGVYQAVAEKLSKKFKFCGIYGCTGLYQAHKA